MPLPPDSPDIGSMLIVCPNCATSYDVDVASLRPEGRRVRCVRCREIWHADLPHREKLIAAAEALAAPSDADEAVAETSVAAAPNVLVERLDHALGADIELAASAPTATAETDEPSIETAASTASAAAESDSSIEVESPPIVPAQSFGQPPIDVEAGSPAPSDTEPPENIESVAARRYPRRVRRERWKWPLSRLQSGILALLIADAIVIGWRTDVVRVMPQTASFYAWIGLPVNLRGLEFANLSTTGEQHESLPILVIGGDIVNTTNKTESVPHLRLAVRNAAHQEIYSWTVVPPRAALPPGQTVAFHTRLASPPPDSHDVLVRFVNRYDSLTGTP